MSSKKKQGKNQRASRSASAVLFSGAAAFAVPAHATNWVATLTSDATPAGATVLGAATPTQPLKLAVSLKLKDQDQLAAFIQGQHTPGNPAYGMRMTPAQFAAAYAPSAAQAQSVADYLTAAGFSGVSISPNRLLVTAQGTVGLAQAAFNTSIEQFSFGGKTVFANISAVQVPDSIGDSVLAVIGLQNASHMQTGPATVKSLDPNAQGMKPQDFATAYDAAGVPTASGTTYGILMAGDVSQVLTDLRTQESMNNLPQVPVEVVNTDSVATATSGVDEWDLDSQSSSGIAGNVQKMIWYVESELDLETNTIASINRWVTDDEALAVNASWGECEDAANRSGFLASTDQILMQAVAQGQTFFASAGDNGFTCGAAVIPNGVPLGQPFQSYPSASPWAVSVGGTTLETDSNFAWTGEKAWRDGGGGISITEPMPDWQNGIVGTSPVVSLIGGASRGCPDVAMSGDPASGLITIVNGQSETVGGTSLSSPLAVGAWSRLQTLYGNNLGFASPVLYALTSGSNPAPGFHDITTGSNVGFHAKAGWDYTTGLGSFDIAALAPLLGPSASGSSSSSSSSGGSSSSSSGSSSSGGAGSSSSSSGGGAAPSVSLQASPVSGTAPLAVSFTASAQDPNGGSITSYSFNFGDGSAVLTQSSPTASHSYGAGSFTASVAVTDSEGGAAESSVVISAQSAQSDIPQASLKVSATSGVVPLAVTFDASGSSDADGTITGYSFNFGDGSAAVSQSTPGTSHTYTAAGDYQASVTVTNSFGASSAASVPIQVSASLTVLPASGPVAELSLTPSSGTAPLTVTLSGAGSFDNTAGASINSYTFSFGDGSAPVTQSTPAINHVYIQPGTYNPSLTVTDSSGVNSALPATASAKVSPASSGGASLAGGGGSSGGGVFGPAALLPLLFGAALRRRRRGA